MKSYESLNQVEKSALIELYFLERLSILVKLPKSYQVDKVSIQASVAPLKTLILPELEKKIVDERVLKTVREMKRK